MFGIGLMATTSSWMHKGLSDIESLDVSSSKAVLSLAGTLLLRLRAAHNKMAWSSCWPCTARLRSLCLYSETDASPYGFLFLFREHPKTILMLRALKTGSESCVFSKDWNAGAASTLWCWQGVQRTGQFPLDDVSRELCAEVLGNCGRGQGLFKNLSFPRHSCFPPCPCRAQLRFKSQDCWSCLPSSSSSMSGSLWNLLLCQRRKKD